MSFRFRIIGGKLRYPEKLPKYGVYVTGFNIWLTKISKKEQLFYKRTRAGSRGFLILIF